MATPQEHIDAIIANAITTANTFTAEVDDAAQALIDITGGAWIPLPETDPEFTVSAIEPDIPTASDSIFTYEAQLEKLIKLLSDQLALFFTTYYPLDSDAFDEAQAWLVNVITNGGTGIDANIEAQVWQRARENVITDGRRAKNNVVTGYAAKNYFLPSGSMLKKLEESDFEQAAQNGVTATAIGAKQLEIEIETVKFAVGKAIDSRTMAMNAATDYLRAIASAPASAVSIAELTTDVQAKMMNATASFYRARLERDDIILRSKLAEVGADVDVWRTRKTNATATAGVDASALASASDAYARSASAALSSLSSVVSSSLNSFS